MTNPANKGIILNCIGNNITSRVMLHREEERMPDMAKRNQNTFLKRQKEIKRQQKAQEKLARRHSRKDQETEDNLTDTETNPEEEKVEDEKTEAEKTEE